MCVCVSHSRRYSLHGGLSSPIGFLWLVLHPKLSGCISGTLELGWETLLYFRPQKFSQRESRLHSLGGAGHNLARPRPHRTRSPQGINNSVTRVWQATPQPPPPRRTPCGVFTTDVNSFQSRNVGSPWRAVKSSTDPTDRSQNQSKTKQVTYLSLYHRDSNHG